MTLDLVLQEVMQFLGGEYLFVCVNKKWRAEYLRQFKNATITSSGAVDSKARRMWVAQYPELVRQLFRANPAVALRVKPYVKVTYYPAPKVHKTDKTVKFGLALVVMTITLLLVQHFFIQ